MNDRILFVGPHFIPAKGGIAFVLKEYKNIFPEAFFVASTKKDNNFIKIATFLKGLFHFLYLLIFKQNIKIIHIHGASYGSFYRKFLFFKISKLFKKKVIYHIHGGKYMFFYNNSNSIVKKMVQNFINNSDCIVCLSKSWKEDFELNFSPKKISIIPNIVSEPKSDFIEANNSKGIKEFLFLGYIDKNKGIFLLLDVINEHKNEIKDKAVFYIGGNGKIEKLQELIQKYELNNIVKFIGWVSKEDKIKYFTNSDVYLLPSFNEGLPLSILEAMSYRLPILSTKVGGIPEIVNSDNGILFDAGSKEELWSAIKFLMMTDNGTLQKMGEVSSLLVKPHMPNAVLSELNRLYDDLQVDSKTLRG